MDKSILKRLDVLQQIADRNRSCKITVVFSDGSRTVTDPAGAICLFQEQGLEENIDRFIPDRPEYDGLCGALSVLCHPVPNRELKDFE